MQNKDFSISFFTDKTPVDVFNAVLNPRAWWSEEITGQTEKINDVFDYQFGDIHRCRMKLIEVVPNQKVLWLVLDNDFNFTNDKTEWINTTVVFEISTKDNKTELLFTHIGLVPDYECYEACYQGWSHYIGKSLRDYIVTGTGLPNRNGQAQTEKERELQTPAK